eukprot:m.802507 g.802507  ORF g.802507 m.802507 type:complete len:250 (-) comp23361_c1_seq78:2435-3184(-)
MIRFVALGFCERTFEFFPINDMETLAQMLLYAVVVKSTASQPSGRDTAAEYHARESRIKTDAIKLAQHVLLGWEGANKEPAVGDTVVPGIHYAGPARARGEVGIVVGKGTGSSWEISWNGYHNQPTQVSLQYGDGKYEFSIATVPDDIYGVLVEGNVSLVDWSKSDLTSDFAEHIAATDMPARLRNTPAVKAWRAMQTWDFNVLLQNISVLPGVKVQRGDCFRYYHRAPMNTVPALVDGYRGRPSQNMT